MREIEAFSKFDSECNPLRLTDSQKILFLYCLYNKDLDVLPQLTTRLLAIQSPFTDGEAGDLLPTIFDDVVNRYKTVAVAGDQVARLRQLSITARAIEQRRGGRFGKTVREQTITPRLEALVDIGVLSKTDPLSYRYVVTPVGRRFIESAGHAPDGGGFIETGFVGAATRLAGIPSEKMTSTEAILRSCYLSWKEIASGLGYAAITDTILLAAIRSLETRIGYFEYDAALAAIMNAQKLSPPLVRLNIDRWGNLTLIKFLTAPKNA